MSEIRGVLFDIDDTLIDLAAAQQVTFRETINAQARHCGRHEGTLIDDELARAAWYFSSDVGGHYESYIRGELSFDGQRIARAQDAMEQLGLPGRPDQNLWTSAYEQRVRSRWRLFDDVQPLLEHLKQEAIPFGAVTNNVEQYQRGKLAQVGLLWDVVIGVDTVGAPKPAPEPFWAGAEALGALPEQVLMVGDNPIADGAGARDAGLISVLIDRNQKSPQQPFLSGDSFPRQEQPPGVPVIESLAEISQRMLG